jgi:hypothetical protein
MNGRQPNHDDTSFELTNAQLAWRFDWAGGVLTSTGFENKLAGRVSSLAATRELALVFSAAVDRVAEPLLRADDFTVRAVKRTGRVAAVFTLHSDAAGLVVDLHVRFDGPTRRKWIEFTNTTGRELLLLDVELDDFTVAGAATEGGLGQPVFLDDSAFAAMEHPTGDNRATGGRVQLGHHPGRRLAPGAKFRSHVALVSVARAGEARAHFLAYIEGKSRPRRGLFGVYTPFGINNQWGACPTLDDEESLDVLKHIGELQRRGVHLDCFSFDTGWVDYSSDLTRFRSNAFPHGPGEILRRLRSLHLKFGLWFATSWGLQSCWDYPGAFAKNVPPTQRYREGFHLGADGLTFCLGEERYRSILQRAVLHHVKHHGVRLLKFDGGSYNCDDPAHGHLPGKYSTEAMHEWLIDLARRARAIAPDVFIIWYWGLRSPFWVFHGDMIFESGLFMEGSGTSSTPTLYYRDSVTLAQDQNAHHARNVPPRMKDSLGVWLSDSRWGNFMGGERWRESLVMDLGRGSQLFPNLWGNLRHLNDEDVKFLAAITALARKNAPLFTRRRLVGGDPFRNEVYGYAHGRKAHGFVFVTNAHFASRPLALRLDGSLGLDAKPGTPVQVVAHFPARQQLRRADGKPHRLGDPLDLWLRPFETLMLEITPAARPGRSLPRRVITDAQAAALGVALPLEAVAAEPWLDVNFADAAQFAEKKLIKKTRTYATTLPALEGDQPILAIVLRLRKGDAEWKYAPTVVQITQVLARVGAHKLILAPMPDGRQHGNTQSFGCSWLTWRARLNPAWAHQPLHFAVHANLPEDVEAVVETWVLKRWWQENPRPVADGYYTYAPS